MILLDGPAATKMSISALKLGKPEAAETLADMISDLTTKETTT